MITPFCRSLWFYLNAYLEQESHHFTTIFVKLGQIWAIVFGDYTSNRRMSVCLFDKYTNKKKIQNFLRCNSSSKPSLPRQPPPTSPPTCYPTYFNYTHQKEEKDWESACVCVWKAEKPTEIRAAATTIVCLWRGIHITHTCATKKCL